MGGGVGGEMLILALDGVGTMKWSDGAAITYSWENVMFRWSSNNLHLGKCNGQMEQLLLTVGIHTACYLSVVSTPLRVGNLSNQINKHQR